MRKSCFSCRKGHPRTRVTILPPYIFSCECHKIQNFHWRPLNGTVKEVNQSQTADKGSVPQSSMSFLNHLAAQILSSRICSYTVSQVETALPLLSWSRTYSTNSSFCFSGVTQGVSCHSVCKGCRILAQALQRKHLKTRRSIIWDSPRKPCAIPSAFMQHWCIMCAARNSTLLYFDSSERWHESSSWRWNSFKHEE